MTSNDELLLEMGVALEESGLLTDLQPVVAHERKDMGSILGVARVEDQEIHLVVEVPHDFPCRLPIIRTLERAALRHIPHVTDAGVICYHETEGLAARLWDPVAVMTEAVSRALETVRKGVLGHNKADLAAEAEWYWQRNGATKRIASQVHPTTQVKFFVVAQDLLGTLTAYDGLDASNSNPPQLTSNGVFIPLDESIIDAGFIPHRFTSTDSLRGMIRRHVSQENRTILAARLRRRRRHVGWLMFGVPRPHGDQALIAINCAPADNAHWLLEHQPQDEEVTLVPFSVLRVDGARLVERGGGSLKLWGRKVAVVGCGSLGGYVADTLARTGIGHLLLVDQDILMCENVFRHVLGWPYVGVPKAIALETALRVGLPFLQVTSEQRRVQDLLADAPRAFADCDIIVNAMGTTTSTRWLNRALHCSSRARLVHTWLEPLGLGGHVVLNAHDGSPGCYECLFTGRRGEELLFARCDLAAPDQVFATGRDGCGGTYTPYGDIDARRTAEIAARVVVETLLDRHEGPRLCSWKGNGRAFLRAGYRTSGRFDLGSETLAEQGSILAHESCPVCGRGR